MTVRVLEWWRYLTHIVWAVNIYVSNFLLNSKYIKLILIVDCLLTANVNVLKHGHGPALKSVHYWFRQVTWLSLTLLFWVVKEAAALKIASLFTNHLSHLWLSKHAFLSGLCQVHRLSYSQYVRTIFSCLVARHVMTRFRVRSQISSWSSKSLRLASASVIDLLIKYWLKRSLILPSFLNLPLTVWQDAIRNRIIAKIVHPAS